MKSKKHYLALLILIIFNSSLFASFGMDMALTFESTVTDQETGDEVSNPYPISAILLPSYQSGKFMMELRLPFSVGTGDEENDDFLDLSVYKPIEKEAGESDTKFITKNISHYLNLISYIQYGADWEDFNFRFGKLSNSTIGDGALVYHYRDSSVASYNTRPGLKVKLDGSLFKLNFIGLEAITNDLFSPDFSGGRVFVKPLFLFTSPILSNLELGFTAISYNADNETTYNSVASDLNLPLFENDKSSMIFYYDLINAKNFDSDTGEDLFVADDYRSLSIRTGLQGRYLSSLSYNAYIKTYLDKEASDTDNEILSDVKQLLENTFVIPNDGDFEIYGETGYYSPNGEGYFVIDSLLNFEDTSLVNYNLGAKLVSFKPVFMLNNIKMYIEKNYTLETGTNNMQESFVEGLTSFKNIAISVQSDVQYGVNVFSVGISTTSDDEGKFSPTYNLGFRISLF